MAQLEKATAPIVIAHHIAEGEIEGGRAVPSDAQLHPAEAGRVIAERIDAPHNAVYKFTRTPAPMIMG